MARPIVDERKTARLATIWAAIGQILSALDDRDLSPALRLLEPRSQRGDAALEPDRQGQPRCVRCATRGE